MTEEFKGKLSATAAALSGSTDSRQVGVRNEIGLRDRDQNSSNAYSQDPRSPSLSVLVLNYNGRDELAECVESLRHTNFSGFTVVVVDNGSTDGSSALIRQRYPWVRVIQLDRNLGFGRAYNRAIRLVDSEYVLLLNNDIVAADSSWISRMVDMAESSSDIGVVGPKLVLASNPEIVDQIGGIVYRWMGCSRLGHGEEDKGQYDKHEVFFIGGGALLMKTKLYKQLGGFDPNIFAYAEDLDLCWRLRLLGYRIAFCPGAVLLHKGSSLWKKFTTMKLRLSQQNFLYCCLKNYSAVSILREIPGFVFLNLVGSLGTSLLNRRTDTLVAVLRSLGGVLLRVGEITTSRARVQNSRLVSEATILRAMGPQRLMSLEEIGVKEGNFLKGQKVG